MSSYALFGRLSTLEVDAGDQQTAIDALSANKQDAIDNATVSEGQAIKDGLLLNKIGTKDDKLTIETTGSIIKLGVDTIKIQEKLSAGTVLANDNSASILVSKKVRGLKGQRGITVSGDDEKVTLQGPPVADWTSGLTTETHYINTGPTEH